MSSQQLRGKTAIVTGASAGIGEAIAIMMAERGASVALCGRNEVRLQTALEKCVKASGGHSERFLAIAGDVTMSNARIEILEKVIKKYRKLDILVNNAGISVPQPPTLSTTEVEEVWDKVMDINLKSVFFLIRAAVPFLEKTKGNIVNISSVSGMNPIPKLITYAASKAGLDHMTRCLALDLGSKGIRVNSVLPSFIPDTEVLRDFPAEKVETVLARFNAKKHLTQPLGELGTCEQVAEIVLFLASDAASFVTGQLMFAAGGSQLINIVPPYKGIQHKL